MEKKNANNSEVSKPINFKYLYFASDKYMPQALSISESLKLAVDKVITSDVEVVYKFNFEKALEIIRNSANLTLINTTNQEITNQSTKVSAVVENVISILSPIVSGYLSDEDMLVFKESIKDVFVNLEKEDREKNIQWIQCDPNHTTYQFNCMVTIQNLTTGNLLLAIPISLTVAVDIEKKKLLKITLKDIGNYEYISQSIQIVTPLEEVVI